MASFFDKLHFWAEEAEQKGISGLREFATFLEGKHEEQDAVELLKSHGYTVTSPTGEVL